MGGAARMISLKQVRWWLDGNVRREECYLLSDLSRTSNDRAVTTAVCHEEASQKAGPLRCLKKNLQPVRGCWPARGGTLLSQHALLGGRKVVVIPTRARPIPRFSNRNLYEQLSHLETCRNHNPTPRLVAHHDECRSASISKCQC